MDLEKLALKVMRASIKLAGSCVALSAMAASALADPRLPDVPGVPEIDGGSLATAVAVLGFAAVAIADRFRRK